MVVVNFGCVSALSLSHNKQIWLTNALVAIGIDVFCQWSQINIICFYPHTHYVYIANVIAIGIANYRFTVTSFALSFILLN